MVGLFIFSKLVLFFFGLWFFGNRLGNFLLRERHPLFSVSLGLSSGVALYIFLINALSYLIAPPASFFAGLALLLGLSLLLPKPTPDERFDLTAKQIRWVIIAAVIVSLLAGFSAIRTLERDDYLPSHIPAASLLAQGNFPPRHPAASLFGLIYHYAPDLLSAALHALTGVPLWLGYDIQTALFSGLIFLVAVLFIYKLFRTFAVAITGAFALLYGGSLDFLLVFPFVGTLFKKFILGYDIAHPFRLIPDMADGGIVRPLISQVHSHTNSLGFLLVLVVLYLFWEFLQKRISWLGFSSVAGLLFGSLALSQETTFVILFAAFLPVLVFSLWSKNRQYTLGLLCFLIIAGATAVLQGGVLSFWRTVLPTFSLAPKAIYEGRTTTIVDAPGFHFTLMRFVRAFGLLSILFVPAVAFWRKRVPWQLLWICIFIIAASILAPFTIYYLYAGEYPRLFHLAGSLLALLAGTYIGGRYFQENHIRWKRILLIVIFVTLVLNGALFQITYAIFPLGGLSRPAYPLVAAYPATPATPLEERTRQWIRVHTTIADWFFAVDTSKKPYTSPNHRFVVLFGRFASTYLGTPTAEAAVYERLVQECREQDLRKLKYGYIFVNQLWPLGLEQKCLANNSLTVVFEDQDQGEFIRIYKIR